jgi:hypothetical protein
MNQNQCTAMAILIFLCGCSSIIEGRSQEIVINTNPSGATCTLVRNDMPVGTVAATPSAILIEKTKYDITVKCNKDGYQEATYFDKSGAAGATVGNIILGGGIGWAIDSATGSDNKYDSPLNITLVPEETASAVSTHKVHHKKTPVEAQAAPSLNNSLSPEAVTQPAETAQVADQSNNFPSDRNGGR